MTIQKMVMAIHVEGENGFVKNAMITGKACSSIRVYPLQLNLESFENMVA
jgi:hypothetical protein